MERNEKVVLVVSGTLMGVFLLLLVYSGLGLGVTVPTCVSDVRPFGQGKVEQKGPGAYDIYLVSRMWFFDPGEIRVPPGADINLYVSALDVTHGVYVESTNVNLMAVPGSVNFARFRLDREGEYRVFCHEYCGLGHQNMAGKIVVTRSAAVNPGTDVAL
ncbi:MAG: cytochrome C oxidase subunit II [Candidatus Binatia bacterium]|nr:cytochrome C oxidase subunit II [Candidatus Binatia bacterium]